jgi:putative transcriptional regulator
MAVTIDSAKERLLKSAKNEFRDAGYSLSDNDLNSSSFDFIAKKNPSYIHEKPIKIIIRVLSELDLFKKHSSTELQLITHLIQGKPLLIAKFANGKKISYATLYRRHNVPAVSLQTLRMFLKKRVPKNTFTVTKFAYRGGIYVSLSSDRFLERRSQLKQNISFLAEKIGVSRQTLYRYEKGTSFPKEGSYTKLTNIMGDDLDQPIDIFEESNQLSVSSFENFSKPRSQLQKEVTSYLQEKDLQIVWFRSEPFDGLSIDEQITDINDNDLRNVESIITGVSSTDDLKDHDRIILLNKLSQFLGKRAIWFDDGEETSETHAYKNSGLFTVLSISELERMGNDEFTKFIKQKKGSC